MLRFHNNSGEAFMGNTFCIARMVVFFLLGLQFAPAHAATILHCSDGDTCRVEITSSEQKFWMNVRLFGIDAPEVSHGKKKGQPFGEQARDALNGKIKGQEVVLKQADLDPFNRPVVEIQYQQTNINLWMIESGLAEAYRGKTKRIEKTPYLQAEDTARKSKKGIWSQQNYVSPSLFRESTRKKLNSNK